MLPKLNDLFNILLRLVRCTSNALEAISQTAESLCEVSRRALVLLKQACACLKSGTWLIWQNCNNGGIRHQAIKEGSKGHVSLQHAQGLHCLKCDLVG